MFLVSDVTVTATSGSRPSGSAGMNAPDWAVAFAELCPERVFSHAAD